MSVEKTFSDNEGNHLMVALDFYENSYKQTTLNIPEEFCDIDIVDINIEKVYLDKPLNPVIFFRMSTWLLNQYEIHPDAVFSFICSTDDLPAGNHRGMIPQKWRWTLFDMLFDRVRAHNDLNHQDIIVGVDEFLTYGRVFYRTKHAPIIHIICDHLLELQRQKPAATS